MPETGQYLRHQNQFLILKNRLGKGGFGEVWRCRPLQVIHDDFLLGERIVDSNEEDKAIKFVSIDILRHPARDALLKRFRRESEKSLSLDHPGILVPEFAGTSTIREAVVFEDDVVGPVEDGLPYFAMPLCDKSLLQHTDQLAAKDRFTVISKICKALNYLHELGLVHRDLKPQNILMHKLEPVICDFGLAKWGEELLTTGAPSLTETGTAMGTFAYMSPHQRINSKNVDSRSDLFSLGLIIYRVLTKVDLTTDMVLMESANVWQDRLRAFLAENAKTTDRVPASEYVGRFLSAEASTRQLESLVDLLDSA